MQITSWGATDVGRARKVNEDAYLLAPDLGLVAVADGMGGFQRGDVASQLACNVVREHLIAHRATLDSYRSNPTDGARTAVQELLVDALQRSCDQVYRAAVAITGEGGRMGTTFDAVLVLGTTAFLAHVGDGRVYLQRGQEVHQITEDHSLVQERLRDGTLSAEEARKVRYKNVITRALGVFPSVRVDTLQFELDVGDRLLLCSDGLHRYLGLRELGAVMAGGLEDDTVTGMVDLANDRGGRDNITAVLCLAQPEDANERVPPTAERMATLRKVDLFQYCTYRELMAVCEIAQQQQVPANSVLFTEGDTGRACYVVVSGAVRVEKAGASLAVLRPGDYFGEMSLLDDPRRSADAVVIEDATLLVLARDRFLQLLKQDSELAAKLMWQLLQKLSRIVRLTNDRLVAETLSLDSIELELPDD